MHTNRVTLLVLMLIFGSLLEIARADEPSALVSLIDSAQFLPVDQPRLDRSPLSTEFVDYNNVKSIRTTEKIKEIGNFDSMVVLDPNADSLWPGAVIQGRSMRSGILDPVNLRRAPGTITLTNLTVSRESGDERPLYSREIKDPTNASIQEAMQEMVNKGVQTDTAAKVSFAAHQFYSLDHAMLKVGMSGSWLAANVRSQLDATSTAEKTHFVVQFAQSYYTVAFSPSSAGASGPQAFFAGDIKLDAASRYIQKDNPPAFVSSVTYGRMLFLFISSSSTSAELRAALNGAFRAAVVSGSTDIDARQREVLQNSDIRILALGGGAGTTVDLLGGADKLGGLRKYLTEGINFSRTNPGVPISYQLRYLKDNSIARLSLATDYQVFDYRTQLAKEVVVTFNLTGDDKDKEEEIQLRVYKGNVEVGAEKFGGGRKWDNPSTEVCSVPLRAGVSANDVPSLRIHMRKTPHGSATGCGMECSIAIDAKLEDGKTTLHIKNRGDQRYGDNNPFDLDL